MELPSERQIAVCLLRQTIQRLLPEALAATQMEHAAEQARDPSLKPADSINLTLTLLNREKINRALTGDSEPRTSQFFQCLSAVHHLQQATFALDARPTETIQHIVSAWFCMASLTYPGDKDPRRRLYVNRYSVSHTFSGPPQTGWYQPRKTYSGTVAALRTLRAATILRDLMQFQADRLNQQLAWTASPNPMPTIRLHIESHPGSSPSPTGDSP